MDIRDFNPSDPDIAKGKGKSKPLDKGRGKGQGKGRGKHKGKKERLHPSTCRLCPTSPFDGPTCHCGRFRLTRISPLLPLHHPHGPA